MVGSFPDAGPDALVGRLIEALDIPLWPQLPRRTFLENMYVQFSGRLPGRVIDQDREKIWFDTSTDLSPALEELYAHIIDCDAAWFALEPAYAAGFYALLEALPAHHGGWIKGQITGPISFGLTVTDQNQRAALYNDLLAEAIGGAFAMSARWQARTLLAARPNVLVCVDEPYLAAFGSAYVSLSREQAVGLLDGVFEAIHEEGAWAAVHCCANTDWSMLLSTSVDVLNLDAFGYLENLALYPHEMRSFLDRGGIVAWGIVPNNDQIEGLDGAALASRLRAGFRLVSDRAQARGVAISPDELAARSLITPACGLGSADPHIVDTVLAVEKETAQVLRGE